MVSLSKKVQRPSGKIGGEQEHSSNIEKNRRECSEGDRPSVLVVGEGESQNALFVSNSKRPNVFFDGEDNRSNELFVDEGKRPNPLSDGDCNHSCNVENGRAEHLPHQDEGTRPMALF